MVLLNPRNEEQLIITNLKNKINGYKMSNKIIVSEKMRELVIITPAKIELDRSVLQFVRSEFLSQYSQEKIDSITKDVDKLIESDNVKIIEEFDKKTNANLKQLKALPKVIGDTIKNIKSKSLEDINSVIEELEFFKREVEETVSTISDKILEPMKCKRREGFYVRVSAPIINKVVDEVSKEEQYKDVDFSLFRIVNTLEDGSEEIGFQLTEEEIKEFRLYSKTRDSIKQKARSIVYKFADQERLKIFEIQEKHREENILQTNERLLSSELERINLKNGTNIKFFTGSTALRQGATVDQVIEMWEKMAFNELDKKKIEQDTKLETITEDGTKVEDRQEEKIVFRIEFKVISTSQKDGILRFFDKHEIIYKEI